MHLDMKRPHGTIVGHPKAVYIQDGHLFDGQGRQVLEESDKSPVARAAAKSVEQRQSAAKDLLDILLSGGPVDQNVVYRESQDKGLLWEDMKNAAIELGVEKKSVKGVQTWKMPAK